VYGHTNAGHAQKQALQMAAVLRRERDVRGIPNLDVLGPAPALVPRVRGRYRWQITLRGGDPAELLGALSFPQGWTVDIDPVSLL
jgi:primosomal protein N' (replication factor Y)